MSVVALGVERGKELSVDADNHADGRDAFSFRLRKEKPSLVHSVHPQDISKVKMEKEGIKSVIGVLLAQKAKLWSQVFETRYGFICRMPSKQNGQLMLTRPELLDGFQQEERVTGCMISSRTFWLADNTLKFQESQLSGSNQSGVYHAWDLHVVDIFHLSGGVLVSTEQFKGMCQIVIYIPSGETRNPVTLLSSSLTCPCLEAALWHSWKAWV